VGKLPALIVLIVDVGKGVAAVAIAYWAFKLPPLYVMLAGLAAVIGHMWMLFLKFSGGRGMGAAVGAILTIFIIYGEWLALGIFGILIVIPLLITRNVALSMSVGFLGLIFITWLVIHSTSATILAIVLGLLVGGKFLPTAIASWRSSKTKKDFVFSERATKKQ
jgi:glycerol-3-phosphate acyltransferase PlsY